MDSEPITILMATFNGAAYLREQLDSILAQTDTGWHLMISDDGSQDDTVAIIEEYCRKYPEKIERHRAPHRFGNARDHFFHLMERCETEFMLLCDQDDSWYPEKVQKFRRAFQDAEARYGRNCPLLVFSDQVPTDSQGNPLAASLMTYQKQYVDTFDFRSILMQNVVTGGAMGLNRSLVSIGCSHPSPEIIMHDWWLAAAAARFGQIIYLNEPLGTYRQHGGNAVGAKKMDSLGYIMKRLSVLDDIKKPIQKKKKQAGAFLEAYGNQMNVEDVCFLQAFEKPHSGLPFYLRHMKLIHGFSRRAGFMLFG